VNVSWDWLKQYTTLDRSVDELAEMLSMSGLNHEGTEEVDGDLAIDLEVTSNRPDCLGHLGVAREWSALTGHPLKRPDTDYPESGEQCAELTGVEVTCPDLCPRYIARVIRNVKVGPSPAWMVRRLKTVGLPSINNIVDITNYVLMECGQPLHAFDYDKLAENRIVVRRAANGETITAIDGHEYRLDDSMCVIADATVPVAIGGVMGGLDTEIGEQTTTILLEAAEFQPLAIRKASRALGLLSESSHRFERGVDPAGVEWASRRATQLIVELAGGEAAAGSVEVGGEIAPRDPVTLPFALLKRILGIDIPAQEACRILETLELSITEQNETQVTVTPPTFRRDLTRPIDLVEEVGRIHGYDHIPTDARVPLTLAPRSRRERVEAVLRRALAGAGVFEAITYSFVDEETENLFTPWSDAPALRVVHSSRKQQNVLRKSIMPSLVAALRANEARGNRDVDLFEIAHVYLPVSGDKLPDEPRHLAVASCRSFREVGGLAACVFDALHLSDRWSARPADVPALEAGRTLEVRLGETAVGYLGQLAAPVIDRYDLQEPCTVLEINIEPLIEAADLTPASRPVPAHPAIERDLSLIVEEALPWDRLAETVRTAAGPHLEQLAFVDLYRGKPIPAGKKSVSLTMRFRLADRTLTHKEVDAYQGAVLQACATAHDATLRT